MNLPQNFNIINPSVAGKFYPSDPNELKNEIQKYIEQADIAPAQHKVLSILTPHAGYPFSGPVAGCSFKYASLQQPDTVLFVALSHYGVSGACVFNGDAFETPLGYIDIDHEISNALIEAGEPIHDNEQPYHGEHSIEVNLPFVQTVFPDAQIATILMSNTDFELCKCIGRRIAHIINEFESKKILIVVSSDMSHFPDYSTANEVDVAMLKALENLDLTKAYETLEKLEHTPAPNLHCVMCGSAAMLSVLETAKTLGGYSGKMLHYQNSGDRPYGDTNRVVGYGSFAIEQSSTPL